MISLFLKLISSIGYISRHLKSFLICFFLLLFLLLLHYDFVTVLLIFVCCQWLLWPFDKNWKLMAVVLITIFFVYIFWSSKIICIQVENLVSDFKIWCLNLCPCFGRFFFLQINSISRIQLNNENSVYKDEDDKKSRNQIN